MRAKEEITEAIKKLSDNKKVCAEFNYFNESNHASIDVMIDVLENQRSCDYIDKTYFGKSHNNWQSAMSVLEYLNGDYEIEDLLYPVKN